MGERYDYAGRKLPLTPEERSRLRRAKDAINARPIFVNFTAADPDKVLTEIERVLLEHGIPFDAPYVVMFDYLQFGLKDGNEAEYDRVTRLSQTFKYCAKILQKPFLILAQLNRAAEGGEPSISDFKSSGQIEQDADVALILWGERVDGQKAPRRLTIVKQRRSMSQITLDYILHQDICRFEFVGRAMNEKQGLPSLTGEREEPLVYTLRSEDDPR
jgi:replicative DNA helicase